MVIESINFVELLSLILWFSLVVVLLIILYRPIRDELLPKLVGFKAMGVELSFVRDSIEDAIELAEKSPQWKVEVSLRDKERVLNRAKEHLKLFKDSQILWVDDHPENNVNERRMFRQLKVKIDIAKSTKEALDKLIIGEYDLLISDMARDNNPEAGFELLTELKRMNLSTPVIFYIGVIDPEKGVPGGAFGITNRPDELLHLTLDALERKRY